MHSLRKIFFAAFACFYKWKNDPKIWLSFGIGFVISFLLSNKVVIFSEKHNTLLQINEAFVWTFGDAKSILIMSLCLLLLFSDIPILTNDVPFMMVRMSRLLWLISQFVYVIIATSIFVCFVLLSTILLSSQNAYTANFWSDTAAILGYSNIGEEIAVPAFVKVLEMSKPYEVTAHIFLLLLGYSVLLSGVVLTFNLIRENFGMVAGIVISCMGFLMNPEVIKNILHLSQAKEKLANIIFGWISPLNHATYYMHNFGYDMLPKLWVSYIFFLTLGIVLFAIAYMRTKKYSFNFTGTGR